jgi:hypothetical protein
MHQSCDISDFIHEIRKENPSTLGAIDIISMKVYKNYDEFNRNNPLSKKTLITELRTELSPLIVAILQKPPFSAGKEGIYNVITNW